MILPFEQHEDDALLDVVLISRARLARNMTGEPFVNRANREDQLRIRDVDLEVRCPPLRSARDT